MRALETLEESQECRERRIVLYQRGKEVYLEEKVIKQNSGGRTPVISVTGDNTGEKKKNATSGGGGRLMERGRRWVCENVS